MTSVCALISSSKFSAMHANLDCGSGDLQQLLESFRSSESISWKMKEIQKFVKSIQLLGLEEHELDDLLETIDLIDPSSKRLKLELAHRFHRPLLILSILKDGDKFLVGRALKVKWMFQANSYDSPLIKPKTLVRVILHGLSYRTRIKIIRRLASNLKDEQKCEEIFNLVREKFGTFSALPLLSSCSSTTIRQVLKNYANQNFAWMLNKRQFLKIVKKDGNLGFEILSQIFNFFKFYADMPCYKLPDLFQYKAISKHLCINYPERFIEFYSIWNNIGNFQNWFTPTKRTTSVLLLNPKTKELILKQPTMYQHALTPNTVHLLVSPQEFAKFLENLLPPTIEKFINGCTSFEEKWIDSLSIPLNIRWNTLNTAFTRKYGKPLNHFVECIVHSSLPTIYAIPSDIRQELSNSVLHVLHKGTESRYDTIAIWIMQLPTLSETPIIAKLNHLLQNEPVIKTALLKSVIKFCLITANIETLIQIMNYVFNCELISSQQRSSCVFELVDAFDDKVVLKNWKKVSSENKLNLVNALERFLLQMEKVTVLFELILGMKLWMNIAVGDIVQKYFNDNFIFKAVQSEEFLKHPQILKSYEMQEKFLMFYDSQLSKAFPVEVSLDQFDLDILHCQLLTMIQNFKNLKYQRKKWTRNHFSLSTYPWMEARLPEFLKYYPDALTFEDISNIPNILDLLFANIEILLSSHQIMVSPGLINYLLIKHPKKLVEDDKFLDYSFNQIVIVPDFKPYSKVFILLNTLGFSKLSTIIVETCLEIAQDDTKEDSVRCNAIKILSILWDPENFLNSLCLFYPDPLNTTEIMSLDLSIFECRPSVRKNVLNCTKNAGNPSKCISVLKNFFLGENILLCTGPLVSACLNAPRLEAVKSLKENFLQMNNHHHHITAKKHIINLLLIISEVEEVHELLLHFWDDESNPEIREFIMKKVIEFICSVEFEKNRHLLISLISTIKEYIEEDLSTTNVARREFLFNPKYLTQMSKPTVLWYMQTVYYAPEKVPVLSMNPRQRTHFIKLLQTLRWIHNNLYSFPHILIQDVLDNFCFNEGNTETDCELAEIGIGMLSAGESSTVISDDTIMKRMVQLKENNFKKFKISLRVYILERCKNCFRMKDKNDDNLMKELNNLEKLMGSYFEETEIFTENVILQLTIMLIMGLEGIEIIGDDFIGGEEQMIEIGKGIGNQIKKVVKVHGMGIIKLYYYDIINKFFKEVCKLKLEDSLLLDLLTGIIMFQELDTENSDEIMIVATYLLPKIPPLTLKLKMKYEKVMEKLKSHSSNTVKTILFNY